MKEKRNRPADEQRKREQDVEDSLNAFLDASLPEPNQENWLPPVLTPEDFEALIQTTPVVPKTPEPVQDIAVMGVQFSLNQSEGELLLKLRQILSPHFQNEEFPTDPKIFRALLKMTQQHFADPEWQKQFIQILSR